jgi:hypothetical protein
MEAGIAKKPGNAGGVKASTAVAKRKDKHSLHAEVEKGWKET